MARQGGKYVVKDGKAERVAFTRTVRETQLEEAAKPKQAEPETPAAKGRGKKE